MPTAKRILILLSVCGAITFAQTFSAPQVQYNPGYRPPLCAAGDSVWLTTNDGIIRFPGLLTRPDPGRAWLTIDGYSIKDIALGGSYQTPRWLVGAQFGDYSGVSTASESEEFDYYRERKEVSSDERAFQEGSLVVWAVPDNPAFAMINGISVQMKGKSDKSDTKREFVNDDEPSERYWELQHEKSGEITVRVLKKMNRRLAFHAAWVGMRDSDTRTDEESKHPSYEHRNTFELSRSRSHSFVFGTVFTLRKGLTLSAECAQRKSTTELFYVTYAEEFPYDKDSLLHKSVPQNSRDISQAVAGLGITRTMSIGNFSCFTGGSLRGARTTEMPGMRIVDEGLLELVLGTTFALSPRTQLFTTVVGSAALDRSHGLWVDNAQGNVTTGMVLSPVGVRVRTAQGIRIELVPLVAESSRKSIQSMISIAW